jgi:hypothetical protein
MRRTFARLARFVGQAPRRLLAAAGWAHMEPTGLGLGGVHTGHADELEAARRRRRETWRREDDPPAP